jgi:hypothetical protein
MAIEDLIKLGGELVELYMNTEASEQVRDGYECHRYATGTPWPPAADAMEIDDPEEPPPGDAVLANIILRLRDRTMSSSTLFPMEILVAQ